MRPKQKLTLQYNPAKLKEIMTREKIECKEIASALNISQSAVVNYRLGSRMGRNIENLKRIARFLKDKGIQDAYSILEPPENKDKKSNKKKETKTMLSFECITYYNFTQEVFPSGYIKDADVLETDNVRKSLSAFTYAARNSGFVLLTGKSGSGKSTITRRLIRTLKQNKKIVPIITDPFDSAIMDPYNILGEIVEQATSYSIKIPFKKTKRSRTLATVMAQANKDKKSICLIIDEAQDLSQQALISLKRSWEKYLEYPGLLSIILVSLPEISFTLNNSQLEQVSKRITEIQLRPFSDDNAVIINEITAYIQHHLRIAGGDPDLFDAGAIKAIAPRVETLLELHNICTRAIMRAYEIKEKKITAKIIATV